MNPYQHIDLRVNDLDRGWAFYSKLLPPLGFAEGWRGEHFHGFSAGGELPDRAGFGFTEDAGHRPNANRIAFWSASRAGVDAMAEVAREAGAQNVSGPRDCPEYSPSYYAVFFEDPFGNCLEVCYRED